MIKDNNDCLIVIARFNEKLDWLKNVNHRYIVYNKGDNDLPSWIKNVSKIDNIGFEEYAYLKFLVEHYDHIPERVTFLQANSVFHSPDILRLLELENNYKDVQPLSAYYSPEIPGSILTNLTKCLWIKNCQIHINFFDNRLKRYNIETHAFDYYPKSDKFLFDYLQSFYSTNNIRDKIFDLIKIKPRIFDHKNMTPMCFGAMFSVRKKNIIKYPKYYYRYLLEISKKLQNHNNKMFAWTMELCWLELFGYEPPQELFKDNYVSLQYLYDQTDIWKNYIDQYNLDKEQVIPIEICNFSIEKIKSCARLSSLLKIPLIEAAKHA